VKRHAALIGLLLCASRLAAQTSAPAARARPVIVASKPFGESFLLCELFAQLLESRGIAVDRRPGLGATEVAFGALQRGAIDVYPEYTGTGLVAVLHDSLADSLRGRRGATYAFVAHEFARRWDVRWLPPLGFENGYAIAVRRETAVRYRLRTLSDLGRASPRLSAGLTADFIGRPDGLPALARAYGIRPRDIRPLAPALKYQALAAGNVDVVDGYSTDALIARYDLVTLEDDRHVFPPYDAAALVGARLARDRPDAVAVLTLLSGRLDVARMRAFNRRVEVDGVRVAVVAKDALADLGLSDTTARVIERVGPSRASLADELWSERAHLGALALRHVLLVGIAITAAVLLGIPLGLALERAPRAAAATIGGLGVVQTIPSIALLAFMLPLFGIGVLPALVALFAYALLPIVRGTYTGVRDANPAAIEAAAAIGMTARQRLLLVRLPIAAPVIMAGVRTAAVIAVGAATLAAFIGAGGLGEPIVAGLALADTRMVLSGALPAALLALLVDGALALVERAVTPAYRRMAPASRS
jgi:osmoprotectant transport system permease protein